MEITPIDTNSEKHVELSRLTGLPIHIFQNHDTSIAVENELVYMDSVEGDRPQFRSMAQRLRHVGFSQEYIVSMNRDDEFCEMMGFDETIHVIVKYAFDKVYDRLPRTDSRGFPLFLGLENAPLNQWFIPSQLQTPVFLVDELNQQ